MDKRKKICPINRIMKIMVSIETVMILVILTYKTKNKRKKREYFLRRITFLRYDYASDAWSFGVTLYEMAMLAPPFKGLNICQAAKAEG